jgi:non-homologous end joining protein Ku
VTCPVALWPAASEADTVRFNMINTKTNNRIRMQTNALNACLAVLGFKQLRGFYCEDITYYHLLCEVGDLKIVGASDSDENSWGIGFR